MAVIYKSDFLQQKIRKVILDLNRQNEVLSAFNVGTAMATNWDSKKYRRYSKIFNWKNWNISRKSWILERNQVYQPIFQVSRQKSKVFQPHIPSFSTRYSTIFDLLHIWLENPGLSTDILSFSLIKGFQLDYRQYSWNVDLLFKMLAIYCTNLNWACFVRSTLKLPTIDISILNQHVWETQIWRSL